MKNIKISKSGMKKFIPKNLAKPSTTYEFRLDEIV